MDTEPRVQILNEADCIKHRSNTLGKSMYPVILPPAMDKLLSGLDSLAFARQTFLKNETSELKPDKFRLKIDLLSHPVRVEGFINTNDHIGELLIFEKV